MTQKAVADDETAGYPEPQPGLKAVAAAASAPSDARNKLSDAEDVERIAKAVKLCEQGYPEADPRRRRALFEEALATDPRNGNALVQLGLMHMGNPELNHRAFEMLALSFDPAARPRLNVHSPQGQWIASMVGRFYADMRAYRKAELFLTMARDSPFARGHDQAIQLATLLPAYPDSVEHAKHIVHIYDRRMGELLSLNQLLTLNNDADPYAFCVLSAFNVELYYEGDIRELMSKHNRLAVKAFPWLQYSAQLPPAVGHDDRRVSLGIVSAFFSGSVLADFQGVLDRLPREKFDITYIYVQENTVGPSAFIDTSTSPKLVIDGRGDWLREARERIEAMKLDMLLYLDSTMSTMCQRLLTSRLARVQACSHGHPITSGAASMDYFISWAAAELPQSEAQAHYTERLILIPADQMHQYYEPRTKSGRSCIDGLPFGDLTRAALSIEFGIPEFAHWYICMQKPFKRHPHFDHMLADLLDRDREAHLILHEEIVPESAAILYKRMESLGADMNRIHEVPVQTHSRLMALYAAADVVLDSYYAGGCTTTRESLEIGAPVVTLPAKYLGGRWTLAYYNIIGVTDLVAKDPRDYVDIAIQLSTDATFRSDVSQRILDNLHKMYQKEEAVHIWTQIIERLARGDQDVGVASGEPMSS